MIYFSPAQTFLVLSTMLMTACNKPLDESPKAAADPALSHAIEDPIMADPELTRQNHNQSAMDGGAANRDLPPDSTSPNDAATARADALALLGGTPRNPPAPVTDTGIAWHKMTAVEQLRLLPGVSSPCLAQMRPGFIWAARMPAGLPIYPRGHVTEAAGSDQPDCQLRAITFRSPVAAIDVIAFYYTLAHKAGMKFEYQLAGGDSLLRGVDKGGSFMLIVRATAAGTSTVSLTTAGLTGAGMPA